MVNPIFLPTVTGPHNFWIRWSIKTAIYLVLTYVMYWVWTLVGNPSIGLTLLMSLAALVAGLYAFARLVGGIAVDIICAGIHLWAHSWPENIRPIPEAITWTIENAGVFLFGYTVIDYTVELVFDDLNLFRDY